MPDPAFVRRSLEALDIRVHQDIILNTSTLLDAREAVIVLPAMTRYEQPGGGTSTSTERMVYFCPEIAGPRIGEARAEWEIYFDLAAGKAGAAGLNRSYHDARSDSAQKSRWPRRLRRHSISCGSRETCFNGAALGCAKAASVRRRTAAAGCFRSIFRSWEAAEGHFYVTTRRGKQFNSMIYGERDSFNGTNRSAVLVNPTDARLHSITEGEAIVLYNDHGTLHGEARYADIARVIWP